MTNEVDRHCERGLIPDVNSEDSPGLSSCDRVLVRCNPQIQRPGENPPGMPSPADPKNRKAWASAIMAVPSLDSAGAALYGRRWEASTRAWRNRLKATGPKTPEGASGRR